MEMETFLQNAGFTKDLRIAFVVCDINSEYGCIQVNSALLKEKDIVTIPQIPYTFSDVDLPAELFQGRFMHTIFSAKGFVPPTHIVNTVTPATAHLRNK